VRSKEELVSEEVKRKDRERRTALNIEKRRRREYEESKYYSIPNELRCSFEEHYDDFYLGD
jgi:hypothetical protein